MRSRWILGASVSVLLLGLVLALWLVLRGEPESPARGAEAYARASGRRSASLLQGLFQEAPPAPEDPRLHIRGLVLGARGPVAGVVVLASAPVRGESLSTLPCKDSLRPGATVLDCAFVSSSAELAEWVAQRQGEVPVLGRATTGADGSFTLEKLDAGRYTLWVESAEGSGLRHGVAAGDEGVELRLGAGVRLSGKVVDDGFEPVPGALVTAIFNAESRFFETLTDASGRYQLGPFPPGEYAFVVSKEGLRSKTDRLTLHSAETDKTFFMDRPRRISGLVLRAGAPVAGAKVLATAHSLAFGDETVTFTDARGRFFLGGLKPGLQKLFATHAGDAASAAVPIFKETLERTDITLELTPAAEVHGVVRDDSGQPIEGAHVSTNLKLERSSVLLLVETDAEGRYRLGPVWPGPVRFEVSKGKDFQLHHSERTLPAGESTVDFTLTRWLRVDGVLVDTEARPIEGEYAVLAPLEGWEKGVWDKVQTGPDGRFSLIAPQPGRHMLHIGGRRVRYRAVEVSAPSSQHIVAERFPSVVGEVVDEAGMPMPGVAVGLWPEGSGKLREQLDRDETDAWGRFALSAPEAGRYRLAAELDENTLVRAASQLISLGAGETRLKLLVPTGKPVSGVVVDPRGNPIPGIRLRVRAPQGFEDVGGGWSFRGVSTEQDGRFTFKELAGEELLLHVWEPGYDFDASHGVGPRGPLRLRPGDSWLRLVLVRVGPVRDRYEKFREDEEPATSTGGG
ncbi:carboxypeptidase regulatory-like domain-containing protein [Archangium violaceum]|uniref:carboxypeptidase regulatory-like domain-containing protein n=1 Tax=Archangium violaceum TaxID=83451 RepID=UPI0036DB6533